MMKTMKMRTHDGPGRMPRNFGSGPGGVGEKVIPPNATPFRAPAKRTFAKGSGGVGSKVRPSAEGAGQIPRGGMKAKYGTVAAHHGNSSSKKGY